MGKPLLVIAGNHGEYLAWRSWREMQESKRLDIRYISSVEEMRGFREAEIVWAGTWWNRKDIENLMDVARTYNE